jgi:type I restriction enzyme S subunit
MMKGWVEMPLGTDNLALFDYENLTSTTPLNYRFKYITLENVNNGKINELIDYVYHSAPSRARRIVHKGDILIATVRPLLHSHYFVNCEVNDIICSTGFCVVKTNEAQLHNKYLYQLLFSWAIDNQIDTITAGSNYPAINSNDIKKIIIPLPPISEQRAIATALSDTDAYITTLEKLIAKKRAIKQGAMQELLTGKRRLPGFSGVWVEKCMGDIGYTYSGLTGKRKENFGIGNAQYITFLNVLLNTVIDITILENVDIFENESQNSVQSGDLFFNTSSEIPEEVGMCAVLLNDLENTYLNSFCFGFRLTDSEINGLFLSYYFNSNYGRKIMTLLAQGATRYNLSKSYFNDTYIKLPSLPEQTAIASILSDMDSEIDALKAKLNKMHHIKQGMMSELLTGRIRLVEAKPVVTVQQEGKIIPFVSKSLEKQPVAEILQPVAKRHNQPIEDAVILAVVTDLYATPQYPLAPFYSQKFPYLLHRHIDGIAEGYHKLAAGPYNPELKYRTALPIAIRNKYVVTRKATYRGITYQTLLVGEKIDQAKRYFSQWHGDEPLEWLKQFKLINIRNRRDELELLTTVDMAMVELRKENKPVTVPAIKEIIQKSKEWKAKLKRELFSDENIVRAINWSNRLFGQEVTNGED